MEDLDSNSDSLIGKTLGTCTLQHLLGRGGMGAVYLAQQSRPRRAVAVKVLLPELFLFLNPAAFREFLARFRREADAIAALDHINIMPIYEYGEQDHMPYLIMPYMTGGTLRDVIVTGGKRSLSEAVTIVEQVAAALDYAHQHGIIHRDLKPGNILFHADGRVLLTDFGIAKVLSEPETANDPEMQKLTMTGSIIGTPEYFSPEQASGLPIDQRSDIYALGIVLFQLLSGHVPFTGTTPVAIAIKHATEQPPLLSRINSAIPLTVEHVIGKALAKKPEQRYATAGEFAQALRAAASEAPTFVLQAPLSLPPISPKTDPRAPVVLMNASTITETPSVPVNQEIPLVLPLAHEMANAVTVVTDHKLDAEHTPPFNENTLLAVSNTPPRVQGKQLVEPRVAIKQYPRRQGSRLSLRQTLFSGILVMVLILGGTALYLHWPSGSSRNQTSGTSASLLTHAPSNSSASPPQIALPTPSMPVGKLLYGTALPVCGAQSSLWSANAAMQVTCDSADTRLTNTNTSQVARVVLNQFPRNAAIPDDYVLEIQAKPSSTANGSFGIFFRSQAGANHQGGFSFMIQPSGYWNGSRIDDATGEATLLYGAQGTALSSTGFTTIDIVIQGDTFQLYFNGNVQGGISSPDYPAGKLGLVVDGGANVLLKNLAIYHLA